MGAGFGGDEEEFKDEDMSKQAKFVGCYKDTAKRDLPVRKGNGDKDTCAERCQDYKYFGHQYKGECWCGNEMGKYGKTTGCKCDDKKMHYPATINTRSIRRSSSTASTRVTIPGSH